MRVLLCRSGPWDFWLFDHARAGPAIERSVTPGSDPGGLDTQGLLFLRECSLRLIPTSGRMRGVREGHRKAILAGRALGLIDKCEADRCLAGVPQGG